MAIVWEMIKVWPTITLIWLPLYLYVNTLGGGIVEVSDPAWLAFTISYEQLSEYLLMAWIVTGLVGTFFFAPGVAKERHEVLGIGEGFALATDIGSDLVSDGGGPLGASILLGCPSFLFGLLRMAVAFASGGLAFLVARLPVTPHDGIGVDLCLAVTCVAGVVAALQLGNALSQVLYFGLRVITMIGLAGLPVGGISFAVSGGAIGTFLLGPVGFVIGAVVGFLLGMLLAYTINAVAKAYAQMIQGAFAVLATGVIAILITKTFAPTMLVILAGVVAAGFSFNGGGGISGTAAGSIGRPKVEFENDATIIQGWPAFLIILAVNGALAWLLHSST